MLMNVNNTGRDVTEIVCQISMAIYAVDILLWLFTDDSIDGKLIWSQNT